jgi:GR25 family glycosyltransferase involved in LPS biosynthesis
MAILINIDTRTMITTAIVLLVLYILLVVRRKHLANHDGRKYIQTHYFNDPVECYLINLKRDRARLAHFKKAFEASDLAPLGFTHREAFDGRLMNVPTMVSSRALAELLTAEKQGYRTKHYQLTRGAVGCFWSHYTTWQLFLETGKPCALIFEDDAALAPNLLAELRSTSVPPDWDILLLGHYCHACTVMEDYEDVLRVNSFFGLHGYIIHRRGVQKIIHEPSFLPIRKQVDLQLSERCASGELKVYALKQQLVIQNNAAFATRIQTPLKIHGNVDPFDPR